MMPIGPLMIEHRLIERMIEVMKHELRRSEKDKHLNTLFVDTIVDFMRTYADHCHHGKEEDILFKELRKKPLSSQHEQIMKDLEKEHKWGRETTDRLGDAKKRYIQGDREALNVAADSMRVLVEFYPKHIEKEDKHFFFPVMEYFSQEEKNAMLEEGYEFDRKLIHEKYEHTVLQVEKQF